MPIADNFERSGELSSGGNTGQTLGQIVAGDAWKAGVFHKYGLDFCCGGKKTVKEACIEKGLDPAKIEQELQQVSSSFFIHDLPYNDWKPGFLADYIVNTHHSYVRRTLPEIRSLALKVMIAHGKQRPELLPIMRLIENIQAEMFSHIMKEEQILFPYIKELDAAVKFRPVQPPLFHTIQSPISMMEAEHEYVGKSMEEIRKLSGNYTLPGDACAGYSLLYKMLAEFESDLHIHVHLENNILFPKA